MKNKNLAIIKRGNTTKETKPKCVGVINVCFSCQWSQCWWQFSKNEGSSTKQNQTTFQGAVEADPSPPH